VRRALTDLGGGVELERGFWDAGGIGDAWDVRWIDRLTDSVKVWAQAADEDFDET
jgi:hypothetical protein